MTHATVALARGERRTLDTTRFTIRVEHDLPGLDLSVFGLDAGRRLRDDRYFTFFNQPSTPAGEVVAHFGAAETRFEVQLDRLPASVERLVVAATHDQQPLARAGRLRADLAGVHFDARPGLGAERAVMLLDVYRHAGGWKVGAVGQGFDGGLQALLESFGGSVGAPAAPEPPTEPRPKVTLGKAERVNLSKTARPITARLRWTSGTGAGSDLDLYAFYVDAEGRTGKVYYRQLGRPGAPPFITHSGDARTPGEETVILHRPDRLRYVLLAAYSAVENGIGAFKRFNPAVTVTDEAGSEVTLPLLHRNTFSYWVAITLFDFSGDAAVVQHVETYSRMNSEAAPRLFADGRWDMNRGEVEFKTR